MSDTVQTSPPELTQLFDCPRFGPLTHRACLRRQTERQEARDGKGRVVEGPPTRAFCASGTCETGARLRQEHAKLEFRACPTCGSALFGGEACARCAARAKEAGDFSGPGTPCPECHSVSKHKAKCTRPKRAKSYREGEIPSCAARSYAPQQGRIWSSDFHEPGFIPPAPDPTREAAAPVVTTARPARGEAAPAGSAPSPAVFPTTNEETTMPKGVRSEPCPTCKSMATCCACKRTKNTAKAAPPRPAAKPAAPAPKKRAEPAAIELASSPPLVEYSLERLLELRNQLDAELVRRRDEAKAVLRQLEAAVEAAQERAA